jgi:hypothetical protein
VEQRSPDRCEVADADDLDRSEKAFRVDYPLHCKLDDHWRRRGIGWQTRRHGLLEPGYGGETGMLSRNRAQVNVGAPALGKGARRSVHHTWQSLDGLKLAEIGHGEGGLDSAAQRIVVKRSHQPARKPRCKLLERQDLETNAAGYGCLMAMTTKGETTPYNGG